MDKRIKPRIGEKFGLFIVVSYAGNNKGRPAWNCQCVCGKIKIILSNNLIRSKSCGCHRILPRHEALANRVYYDYRFRAKKKKLEFSLSKKELKDLILQNCYYCGSSPNNYKKTSYDSLSYNGIDRINNSKGYVLENCRPCCFVCNVMKLELTELQFKNQIKKVYEKLF